jgi:Protein of unknown function (DUF4232)
MPVDDRINDLGARLGALAAEGASSANPPSPAAIRRRSRRRRAVMTVTIALTVACAVAVVRAGWPEPAPTTTTVGPLPGERVVPWIPAPARSGPVDQGQPTVPPDAPACTTGQLQASVGWEGATGSLAGGVAFTNRGMAPCVLAGYPTIELLDGHGRALRLTGLLFGGSKTAPPPVLLRSDSRAHVEFHWMNWCGQDPGTIGVRITLPRGGVLVPTVDPRTPRQLTPRCDAPASPSLLSRGPFVAERSQPPPDPRSALRVQVAVPDSVMAGQRLRYTVTLTNPTNTPLSLGECPSYEESVSLENGGTASERHLLNCPPVGAIGAGQKVNFAMILDIPAGLRPGNGVLVWELLLEGPTGTKVPITLNTRAGNPGA